MSKHFPGRKMCRNFARGIQRAEARALNAQAELGISGTGKALRHAECYGSRGSQTEQDAPEPIEPLSAVELARRAEIRAACPGLYRESDAEWLAGPVATVQPARNAGPAWRGETPKHRGEARDAQRTPAERRTMAIVSR